VRSWPALLVAPLVALGQQSSMYALVPPACEGAGVALLHAIAGAAVAACAAMTAMAWRSRKEAGRAGADERTSARRRTLAVVATMVGVFSTLVCAAMWAPVWLVSPCAV
jgi:hypothetical protein